MTANELLVWLSARKEGSWPQFRGAVEALEVADSAGEDIEDGAMPVHQRVRFSLERLCHVEFDAEGCEDRWRVVPPVLAIVDQEGQAFGVLCGARTPKHLESIESAANGFSLQRYPAADSPDIVRVRAPATAALVALAQRIGIRCQIDAPTALLSHLPCVDRFTGGADLLPASGKDWDVKHFIAERKMMKWRSITLKEANAPGAQGLFCFTRFQMPLYFLREGANTVRVPGAVGKYRILCQSRRSVLRYDRKEHCISVPAIFRPPRLTERAMVLCSGFPPSVTAVRGRPWLTYKGVPEEIAGMVAEVLRQDLL
jgi:hypothetical protein